MPEAGIIPRDFKVWRTMLHDARAGTHPLRVSRVRHWNLLICRNRTRHQLRPAAQRVHSFPVREQRLQ